MLDEFLFTKIANYFKNNKKVSSDELVKTVFLENNKEKLTILARAITGNDINIFPAEKEGGYKNNSFFLPSSFNLLESHSDNYNFMIYRVLYLSIQHKLNLNWNIDENQTLEIAQLKSKENAPQILELLFHEFPITKDWYESFFQFFQTNFTKKPEDYWLYGKFMVNSPEIKNENKLQNISEKTLQALEKIEQTILKAKAIEEVISIEVDQKQQEDYVLTHNFEKIDTAEEFNGSWRDFDGDDELKDHENALDEINMKFTVRVDDPVHSVYQADFIENTTVSESAEIDGKGFHLKYDEWDYVNKNYKIDYCKVYPVTLLKTNIDFYNSTLHQNATVLMGLRKMLTNVNNKMQQLRRQTQGDEFDIDSITDLYVDIHSKITPSDKIYLSKRKKEKDLSILLLLDISLSSDGYADGNRIIDVEKQVSILFGEILNEFDIDFSIHAFFSKTRNYSTFQTLKGFDENWNQTKYRIGAIEPEGFTRIGAALRHAGAVLDKQTTRNKWIVLISDGKPNDFDKYEGKYGVNDVKQALRELNQRQINSYALAIEANAKYYLPQMFGQNHFQILTKPTELLQSLAKLYDKIKQ